MAQNNNLKYQLGGHPDDKPINAPLGSFDEIQKNAAWKAMMTFMEEQIEQLQDDLVHVHDKDLMRILQGRIQAFNKMKELPEFLKQQKQQEIDMEE